MNRLNARNDEGRNLAIVEDIYNRLLAVNRDAFEAGLYDAAYHARMSALRCAEHMESDQALLTIKTIASEQLAFIDEHLPEYHHSSQSALEHNQRKSIYALLSDQAEAFRYILRLKNSSDGSK